MKEEKVSNELPIGVIVMWSGAIYEIPRGWSLCDGVSINVNKSDVKIPDLTGRFIVGAGIPGTHKHEIGNTGGEKEIILKRENLPPHCHSLKQGDEDCSVDLSPGGAHTHTVAHTNAGARASWTDDKDLLTVSHNVGTTTKTTSKVNGHSHAISGKSGNGTHDGLIARPFDNRPPYYALAFIIKIC